MLSGAPNEFVVIREGREIAPSDTPGKVQGFRLRQGDVVSIRSSGGGGCGDPLKRDPVKVLEDVRQGYLSETRAAAAFGVVIHGGKLDAARTRALRAARSRATPRLQVVALPEPMEEARIWAHLAPCDLSSLGLVDGDVCEIADAGGPSLRVWAHADPHQEKGGIGLPPLALRILRLRHEPVSLRALTRHQAQHESLGFGK